MTGEPGVLVYCCESAEFREYSPLFALMLCDQLALAAFTKYPEEMSGTTKKRLKIS